jgi:hypothetical protein
VDNGQKRQEETQRGAPWGFFLVLAAIVVVAIVYSVTILAIDRADRTPEVVFGAMAASFTVIGTLVGTYFGIKAGLDGQDRVKDSAGRTNGRGARDRPDDARRDGDPQGDRRQADGRSRDTDRPRVLQRTGSDDQDEWGAV